MNIKNNEVIIFDFIGGKFEIKISDTYSISATGKGFIWKSPTNTFNSVVQSDFIGNTFWLYYKDNFIRIGVGDYPYKNEYGYFQVNKEEKLNLVFYPAHYSIMNLDYFNKTFIDNYTSKMAQIETIRNTPVKTQLTNLDALPGLTTGINSSLDDFIASSDIAINNSQFINYSSLHSILEGDACNKLGPDWVYDGYWRQVNCFEGSIFGVGLCKIERCKNKTMEAAYNNAMEKLRQAKTSLAGYINDLKLKLTGVISNVSDFSNEMKDKSTKQYNIFLEFQTLFKDELTRVNELQKEKISEIYTQFDAEYKKMEYEKQQLKDNYNKEIETISTTLKNKITQMELNAKTQIDILTSQIENYKSQMKTIETEQIKMEQEYKLKLSNLEETYSNKNDTLIKEYTEKNIMLENQKNAIQAELTKKNNEYDLQIQNLENQLEQAKKNTELAIKNEQERYAKLAIELDAKYQILQTKFDETVNDYATKIKVQEDKLKDIENKLINERELMMLTIEKIRKEENTQAQQAIEEATARFDTYINDLATDKEITTQQFTENRKKEFDEILTQIKNNETKIINNLEQEKLEELATINKQIADAKDIYLKQVSDLSKQKSDLESNIKLLEKNIVDTKNEYNIMMSKLTIEQQDKIKKLASDYEIERIKMQDELNAIYKAQEEKLLDNINSLTAEKKTISDEIKMYVKNREELEKVYTTKIEDLNAKTTDIINSLKTSVLSEVEAYRTTLKAIQEKEFESAKSSMNAQIETLDNTITRLTEEKTQFEKSIEELKILTNDYTNLIIASSVGLICGGAAIYILNKKGYL